MMIGLFLANGIVNAYMGYEEHRYQSSVAADRDRGCRFRIDYALYIVSRAVEEYPQVTGIYPWSKKNVSEDAPENEAVTEAVRRGLATAGKAVTFTAITLVMATLLWAFSNIRFCSEMGLLLALWMGSVSSDHALSCRPCWCC